MEDWYGAGVGRRVLEVVPAAKPGSWGLPPTCSSCPLILRT